jgi:hypothetical protein
VLDLTFEAGLRFVLDEHLGATQGGRVEFGLAGAVPAECVDVHAGTHGRVLQHDRVALVGGAGGDDVRTGARLPSAGGPVHREPEVACVARQLVHRAGVDVEDPEVIDAEDRTERQRLELRLGTTADHRHHRGVRPGQGARRHRRGRGGP